MDKNDLVKKLKRFKDLSHLTMPKLAQMLGLAQRTIEKWFQEQNPGFPGHTSRQKIRALLILHSDEMFDQDIEG